MRRYTRFTPEEDKIILKTAREYYYNLDEGWDNLVKSGKLADRNKQQIARRYYRIKDKPANICFLLTNGTTGTTNSKNVWRGKKKQNLMF